VLSAEQVVRWREAATPRSEVAQLPVSFGQRSPSPSHGASSPDCGRSSTSFRPR
jgi:hypothetical protein